MTGLLEPHAIGLDTARRDGRSKVTGTATYAYETPVERPAYCHPVQATIARGRIESIDASTARDLDGVLSVIVAGEAERLASLADKELAILQDRDVAFRGQLIGVVIAETSEIAREAADLIRVDYAQEPHDTELSADREDLYKPEKVNPSFPADTSEGDVDAAMAAAEVTLDETYSTSMLHNNPMEPHATTALWDGWSLTLWDSTQGVHPARDAIAEIFGLDQERVRVICPYVGGGFGSKGLPHANVVLAAIAARAVENRPVKLALTRQQMFSLAGYRTPTIQRMRLAADSEGRLSALALDVVEQTSKIKEFAEQTAVAARMMYASPNRGTSHRLAALDVPVPSWMRAPGECPGMFGPEVAMDELAERLGLDPIELRIRNEPERDPETGNPFSSRNLVACLREGAERFGWAQRDPRPGVRRENGWLVGTGVAASVYPTYFKAGAEANIRFEKGRYIAEIGAADLGTGTWTALPQVAADALGVPPEDVEVRIGDTAYPTAPVAGGSSGMASWGWAIVEAARVFRDKFGGDPDDGDAAGATAGPNEDMERYAMYAFGAQFVEARVHADTAEVRVPRMLGVFAAGRIINPRTARSQFVGGMTMGLSMALHENSVLDPRTGHVVNHDLAEYHIAANADVGDIQAHWIDEHDPYVNPMGSKGIGEIGIVGAAAAVANAVYHATGRRVRDLPITLDKLL
ncbi:xanthine dehydrogenase family protein molybdopterin-binding subunit [Amycolatopsis acidiphila]|uniref:Xanthine dehydrogenase family protein molybdopterin-binding subunit n=1 Tax=Amycolatopsis acidiphila TaxID=715473 RepID=A0A557ZYJ9_9PSEU|nr:xanthine dehydrogenase family protein molybdopterin-binding subunit [Amycolatopsis acidiphila]TVT17098.1 xanthine dehydrogenase family protein molybdopterin-binding subunit [Amycolatopsis acidiphila]UIJ61958.1 xanthine dehydrogenase family protein molybdopterin-binding subunit [Amycolatopsis acidiphila]GHG56907.1 xanthine dehydrogenase [Amycolatopsis acidiphila]